MLLAGESSRGPRFAARAAASCRGDRRLDRDQPGLACDGDVDRPPGKTPMMAVEKGPYRGDAAERRLGGPDGAALSFALIRRKRRNLRSAPTKGLVHRRTAVGAPGSPGSPRCRDCKRSARWSA